MDLLMRLYYILVVLLFVVLLAHIQNAQAGQATGIIQILIKVHPICNINGIPYPVQSLQECIQLKKAGVQSISTLNRDGSRTVSY